MSDEKKFDHLISVIYEIALDNSCLKEALRLCGEYVGGIGPQLITMNKKDNAFISVIKENFPFEAEVKYSNYYMAIDPRLDFSN